MAWTLSGYSGQHFWLPFIQFCDHVRQTSTNGNFTFTSWKQQYLQKSQHVCSLPDALECCTLILFIHITPITVQRPHQAFPALGRTKEIKLFQKFFVGKKAVMEQHISLLLSDFSPPNQERWHTITLLYTFLSHSFASMQAITECLFVLAPRLSFMPQNSYLLFFIPVVNCHQNDKHHLMHWVKCCSLGNPHDRLKGEQGWMVQQLPLVKLQCKAFSCHCKCQQTIKWSIAGC